MKLKGIMLAALLLAVLTIGAVNAADDNVTSDDLAVSSNLGGDVLVIGSAGTFSDLSNLIEDTSENGTLKLKKDYQDTGYDSGGINISKPMTIDGKGHALDANKMSRIFHIQSSGVTLKNIMFKNGKADMGGAILGNSFSLVNCTFINCCATGKATSPQVTYIAKGHGSGGAVSCEGNGCNITGCTFIDNRGYGGGAISFNSNANGIVNACRFVNCSVTINSGSAIIFNSKSSGIVSDCTFIDCYSESGGTVLFASNSKGSAITNCSFRNNKARNGGAVYIASNSIGSVVRECSFLDCSATGNGGAVNIGSNATDALVIGCNFTNNNAKYAGAVYFAANSTGDAVSGCNFVNCSSTSNGGVVILASNSTGGAVSGCSFVNCSSSGSGNIFFGVGYEGGVVNNCSFTNSKAKNGGAVFVATNSTDCVVSGCSFVNCSSISDGGAVEFKVNTTGNVTDCIFMNCSSASNGGAIYFECKRVYTQGEDFYLNEYLYSEYSSGNVVKCSFLDCSAPAGSGGAIYFGGSISSVVGCDFRNCSANSYDDICFEYNSIGSIVRDCSFVSYSANYSREAIGFKSFDVDLGYEVMDGDDMYSSYRVYNGGNVVNCSFVRCSIFTGCNSSIVDCSFVNCSSKGSGGAIYLVGSNNCVMNCIFVNCSSRFYGYDEGWEEYREYGYGGAIYVGNGDNVIRNCTFLNCFSVNGGAIGFVGYKSKNEVIGCSFVNCSSSLMYYYGEGWEFEFGYGGAIFFENYENNGVVANCSFVNCFSDNEGGAIFMGGNDGSIMNCSFVGCSAKFDGGAISASRGNVKVISSNFENNRVIYPDEDEYGFVVSGGVIFDSVFKDNSKPEFDSKSDYDSIVPEEMDSEDDGIVILEFPKDAEGTVEVFMDGVMVEVVQVVKGIAKIDLSKYKGTHLVTFEYSGDDNYPAFTKNSIVTIVTAKITAYNRQSFYALGQKYTLTVYETEGVLAKGALVVVKVNGKDFTSVKTNENGVAAFTITQAPGTYVLTMTSLGKSVSKSLKVKHSVTLKTVKVKKSAKKLVLTATVGNKNKVLRHKKVTFKFNGKKYTKKTDKYGVAKVTIKSSVLKKLKVGKKVTYQATYAKDTVKKTAKVRK